MVNFQRFRFIYFLGAVLLLVGMVHSQEVGGPYTADSATVLLMHFDGDLTNESTLSADGVFHGDASNFYFLPNPVSGLDQCLRIDNDSKSDSAFVTVADTAALDLTGNWTIEGWINIFTFGTGPDDWRWVPRLVIKTGDEVFWRPNYFVEMWGSTRFFSCGYHTASQDAWPQANSPDNTMVPGQWYHLAFVRDTTRHILLTIIHNANRELVAFSVADYLTFNAADPTPITTNQPVHIGYAGGGGDSFLDGFVDEIRISNVVREFPIPPIITNVSVLSNQPESVPQYDVGAQIFTLFSSTIQTATLYYSVDNGQTFNSVPMTNVVGDSFVASIPAQPFGSIVKYYVKAVDDQGLSYTQPQTAETDSIYFSFGVFKPNTQTLALGFEEGSGVPLDTTVYSNPVTMIGNPTFSTNAAVGNYSIYLEGDSSYLEVDSPFLSSEEFCVDFWFNADSMRTYCRIINRPNDAGTWWTNNFQVRFNPDHRLYAGSDGSVTITLDDSMHLGEWYHVIYEVKKAPAGDTVSYYAVLRLADANDNVIEQKYAGFDTPVIIAQAPLRIGKAAYGGYPPYYMGYLDNINIYNYPAADLPLETIVGIDNELANTPRRYELKQNFPNPFNPVTEIRFELPRTQDVKIVVYDVLGRKVRTLVDAKMSFGRHAVVWDGTDDFNRPVASGIYFYQMVTKNFTKVRKMILMK